MIKKLKPYIMLTPVMLIILGIFVMGLIIAFSQSLGYFPVVGLKDFTLKYYKEVLTDKSFLDSFKFSLYISFVSSVLAVVIGVLLAYSIFQSKNKRKVEEIIYKLPIIVPHSIAALLVYNMMAQSGVLSRILYYLGFIEGQGHFPSLIFDRKGIGIIISYLWKEIPFIAMVVYTVLSNINEDLFDAASNLGANKRQVFWKIILPLILPSILSSFIIIFAFSFGAFEVPYLLGPTTPKTLPVKAYIEYTNPDLTHRPYTMVINMILTFYSLILVWLYSKSFKLISRFNI
ncbi:ABC transporter permease [Maledivibacter halophilus]|uniref:Putative spermidine/putrescine transport system permease protein n=1 Tax=Maledivibacter halophilus TaxID=36842 RepID=A0A1T5MS93_9FIRM|nr:ABC transporter permease subunit [Maledivibacter halophilus]SKC90883.1 putative spermidine/putrescine transport system permease protein [Maledivibacter halophilus]